MKKRQALDGRKAIADWLTAALGFDVSVDQVKRWEVLHALPVHRLVPQRPIAYVDELEQWVEQRRQIDLAGRTAA
jgi:hypothetical protein